MMKAAIIVVAGIMAIAGPVFAQEATGMNYPINYTSSEKEKEQILKHFKMYEPNASSKYKNDMFDAPELTITEGEESNFYKKAK